MVLFLFLGGGGWRRKGHGEDHTLEAATRSVKSTKNTLKKTSHKEVTSISVMLSVKQKCSYTLKSPTSKYLA